MTPAAWAIASMAIWPDEVAPAVPTEIWWGLAFMAASSSPMSLNVASGLTLTSGTLVTVRNRCQFLTSVS